MLAPETLAELAHRGVRVRTVTIICGMPGCFGCWEPERRRLTVKVDLAGQIVRDIERWALEVAKGADAR